MFTPFFLFLFGYILSFTGFLLGRATLEEHDEIKKFVQTFNQIILIGFYAILLGFFAKGSTIFILLGSIIIFIIGAYLKDAFLSFHHLVFYTLAFRILNSTEYVYLSLILIFSFMLDNSFRRFHFKEEISRIIMLILLYVLFSFFT